MFNVGGGELLVILLIALMVLGPDRLPGFARKAGKVMGDVRRISQGFQSEIRDAMDFRDDDSTSTPSGTGSATAAPRLVEPPTAPPAIPPSGSGTGAIPTPGTAGEPVSADRPTVDQSTPDQNGDEPASGTSAA